MDRIFEGLSLDEKIQLYNKVYIDTKVKKVEENDPTLKDYAENTENCILYDYFSVTSKEDDTANMIELLGLEEIEFEILGGFNGFSKRMYYKGISIHYDYYKDDSIKSMLEMSGQGCRLFEEMGNGDWNMLFSHFTGDEKYNITRLDVAYDDHTGVLDINRIADLTINEMFVAKARSSTVELSTILKKGGKKLKGTTVYIGSKKSDVLIRIYNKAVERGFTDRHWVRCEMQLRRERAVSFIKNELPLGEKYSGVVNNYLRYVVENPNDTNRKDRWKTEQFWLDFVQTVEKISIFTKKGTEYNLAKVERYVLNQAGNSIDTYIKCEGLDFFVEKLKKRESRLQRHQEVLIFNHNREKTNEKEKNGKQAVNSKSSE